MASALDPRFKDLKYLPTGEREEVWTNLEALLQEEPSRATPEETLRGASKGEEEPPAVDSALTQMMKWGFNRTLSLYKAEPSISMEESPLQRWSTHAGAHLQLSALARKYLATPATSVPCERLSQLQVT